MAILDEISNQMKAAMKAKEKARLTALRSMRAAFIETMKADGSETISDDQAVAVMRRLAKQRADSISEYRKAGREDLVAVEEQELLVIEEFLPKLADESTTRAWVQDAIDKTGASGMGDLGRVMGQLMSQHQGEIDGKLANRIVRELLG